MNSNEVNDNIFNFILENVKLTSNIQDLPKDASEEQKSEYNKLIKLISLYINMVCKEIKIRTNRVNFPEDLKYLAIDMTNNMYTQYKSDTNSESNQVIQSMSETGRSVNFGTEDTIKIKLQLLIQRQLDNQNKLINRYRLLYKAVCPKDEQN